MHGPSGPWIVIFALALLELGRNAELVADELGPRTPWREAAVAIGSGDITDAADILHSMGCVALEAHARLRAARQLARDGRRSEAASQLSVALAFYRGVGAAAAVRAAEELLPAAG